MTQALQWSEVAKPVTLEFQQEGRGGIGDSKWIIVLGEQRKETVAHQLIFPGARNSLVGHCLGLVTLTTEAQA